MSSLPPSCSRELCLAYHHAHGIVAHGPWLERLEHEAPTSVEALVELWDEDSAQALKDALVAGCGELMLRSRHDRWFDVELWCDEGWTLLSAYDRTTQHQALTERLQRDQHYRLMLENSGQAFLVHDVEGRLLDANKATLDSLGYTLEEFRQLRVYEIEMTIKPQSLTGIWNRVPPGKPIILEGSHRRKDGTCFPVEVNLQTAEIGGQRLVLAMTRDISMRKTADEYQRNLTLQLQRARDQANEANRAKSTFLANMSHELRTPLNAVLGYTELIMEEAQEQGHQMYQRDLVRIQQASSHLLGIINDILDLSKIEAGKLELSWEEADLEELLVQCIETVSPMAREHHNTLDWSIHPQAPKQLYTDRLKLKQVLLNLLANANKFTQQGKLSLTLSARQDDQDLTGSWIDITVQDSGIGISQDKLATLFDPFVQADVSTSKLYGGTGLGLSISQRLVQLMGGDIKVSSQPGVGSTFTISLPQHQRKSDGLSLDDELHGLEPVPVLADAPLVLVIDDDVSVQEQLRRTLTHEGYQVISAFDGHQGLAQARALRPAMLFMEVRLRHHSGLDLLEILRQDPTIAHLPVIMISSGDHAEAALRAGAMAYLSKPLERARIIATTEHYTRQTTGRLLVADDDPASREIIQRSVDSIGWETIEASDGKQAIERLHQHKPDVVVLDLAMPHLDGFEVVRHIRATPGLEGLPIIVVTGRSFEADVLAKLSQQVTEVLRKGEYSVGKLLTTIQRAHRAYQLELKTLH